MDLDSQIATADIFMLLISCYFLCIHMQLNYAYATSIHSYLMSCCAQVSSYAPMKVMHSVQSSKNCHGWVIPKCLLYPVLW